MKIPLSTPLPPTLHALTLPTDTHPVLIQRRAFRPPAVSPEHFQREGQEVLVKCSLAGRSERVKQESHV